MVFSSAVFLYLFLPLVLLLYYVSPMLLRNSILILSSLCFYMWGETESVYVLLASIGVNWVLGLLVGSCNERVKTYSLGVGIVCNLLVLVYYKYYNFFISVGNDLTMIFSQYQFEGRQILLPLGISFFTFHSISYLVDIHRGQARPLRNPFEMGLYICFFPQLVAGPIIRYHDIADQIRRRTNTLSRFSSGVERFVFGLGKKIIIANTLGAVADKVFATQGSELSVQTAWVGIVCYTLQIYFDFSGYSDMAIGLARMFGFELPENFNYPYIANSIRMFWRRWHLSLSTWFRDYMFIPLGGSRGTVWRTQLNLFLVFAFCGMWHGASWNFVFWGVFHGVLLVVERGRFGDLLSRIPSIFGHCYTLFAVMIGWVFFRADSFGHAFEFLKAMFGEAKGTGFSPALENCFTPQFYTTLFLAFILSTPVFTFLASDWKQRIFPSHSTEPYAPALALRLLTNDAALLALRIVVICVVLFFSLSQLAITVYNPFIYYRF